MICLSQVSFGLGCRLIDKKEVVMGIEKNNSRTSENVVNGEEKKEVDLEFPPFDPEKAERLVQEAKEKGNTVSIDVEAAQRVLSRGQTERAKTEFDPSLYESESAWRHANFTASEGERVKGNWEYDFRRADRYNEQTFMLAAADSLADSPNIMHIDRVALGVSEKARKDQSNFFEALDGFVQESNGGTEEEFAAADLMNAFIDTTATYIISKDEKPARGFAKGLMTKMEMRLAGAVSDRPNQPADEIRVDLMCVQPIMQEFIEGYNPAYESPNDFKNYLETALQIEESNLRFAEDRYSQSSLETKRRMQALKSAISALDDLQSHYEANLKNLRDTAYAHHRIIK